MYMGTNYTTQIIYTYIHTYIHAYIHTYIHIGIEIFYVYEHRLHYK